ncbi:hypothetical protein SESBI_02937 [Sesbania bispinosa]|nr:hypothetical protein SESBI_02937 [Sesbania bispinosa]
MAQTHDWTINEHIQIKIHHTYITIYNNPKEVVILAHACMHDVPGAGKTTGHILVYEYYYKVGDISNLDRELKKDQKQTKKKQNLGMFSQSELDLFMEAYCLALSKLKEAMEEPQQKSMAFINNMHSQLRELTKATTPSSPPEPASSSTEAAQKAMIEEEQQEKVAATKRKRPSKATRSKHRRLLSPVREEVPAPAEMITRNKSIPKDDARIFQEALQQIS